MSLLQHTYIPYLYIIDRLVIQSFILIYIAANMPVYFDSITKYNIFRVWRKQKPI
jgi:hypothetical protein